MERKYIAYYRVSTTKQGAEGLGIEAQREAVEDYANGFVIESFTEIESGTSKKKRIEIYKAIDLAKKENAVLLVAKLDRLARDVTFTSALYDSGVEFVCADNPHATKFTIQLLSVVAQDEAERISKRVKEALKVKKDRIARGNYTNKDGSQMKADKIGVVRLGNPEGFKEENRNLGLNKRIENARGNKANIQAMDFIQKERLTGETYKGIADKLNALGYLTRRCKEFKPAQVHRLFIRYSEGLSKNESKLNNYLTK